MSLERGLQLCRIPTVVDVPSCRASLAHTCNILNLRCLICNGLASSLMQLLALTHQGFTQHNAVSIARSNLKGSSVIPIRPCRCHTASSLTYSGSSLSLSFFSPEIFDPTRPNFNVVDYYRLRYKALQNGLLECQSCDSSIEPTYSNNCQCNSFFVRYCVENIHAQSLFGKLK